MNNAPERPSKDDAVERPGKDRAAERLHSDGAAERYSDGAAERLQIMQARIRLFFERMPVALIMMRCDGTIEAVNRAAEEMFETPAKQLARRSIHQLFQPDAERTNASTVSLLTKSVDNMLTINAIKQSGKTFPVDISVSRFEEHEGGRFLISLLDVSERVKLEEARREFSAMIAHDVRTPLTSCQAFLSGVSGGLYDDAPGTIKERATSIQADLERVLSLVSGLLEIEKMEGGKLTPVKSRFPVESAVRRAVNSVESMAESKGVMLAVQHLDEFIYADQDQLVQVLVNLLGNAIKFSPEGGTVKLSARVEEIAHESIEFRVDDEGPGIPKEFRDKIFDRFEQVERTGRKEGTGLGLAISKAIVLAHDGTISVQSVEGQGSSFIVRLPV